MEYMASNDLSGNGSWNRSAWMMWTFSRFPHVFVSRVHGEAQVDPDHFPAPPGHHFREAPGPHPHVEHPFPGKVGRLPAGLGPECFLRLVGGIEDIDLDVVEPVPFEAESVHVLVPLDETGNSLPDREPGSA